jgi:hypothetical protein
MRVRIGVTGHRRLDDEAALAVHVREQLKVISELFASTATTPVHFTVFSALAEGADRLVVREARTVLAPHDVDLVVVLPLDRDEYSKDFLTEASRAEYYAYLGEAATVVQATAVPGDVRDDAYWRAGREVVDRSDVVIAIWDGQPAHGTGGTGDVVAYAEKSGVAVLRIATANGAPSADVPDARELGRRSAKRLGRAVDAQRRLRVYNASNPAIARLGSELALERGWSPEVSDRTAADLFAAVRAWALPHFTRAEFRARRAQRLYHLVVDALFALAAIAVAAVAYQISFQPEHARLALFETIALVLLSAAFVIGRKVRLHEAWIGYRSLAEAFRSSQFIAAIGGDSADDAAPSKFRDEPWFQRAFTEAWTDRPTVSPKEGDVAAFRNALATSWIKDQIDYHRSAAERAQRRHMFVTYTVEALLLIAIVLSILHAFEVFHDQEYAADTLEFLAIALPGASAALTGHREHRQYRLNAERSRRTAERLDRVHLAMQAAPDLPAVRRLAGEAQTIMVEENRDWFGVAELQELELSL